MNALPETQTAPVIRVSHLSKEFGGAQALRNVDLEIPRGSIVGFVGANGAGKSTLMRIMTGLYIPTHGSCMTLGQHAEKIRGEQLRRIGYVHQEGKLIGWMYVRQLIRFVAGHYPETWNHKLADEFVKRFDIPLNARISTMSPGKRQQLAILLAIGFEPELLILDEPAAGLDPLARYEFLQLLLDLVQSPDRTILISSHILADIEQVIDRVVIFKDGEIIRDCAFDALQEEFVQLRLTSRADSLPAVESLRGVVYHEHAGHQALVVFRREHYAPDTIAATLNCELEVLPLNFEGIYRLIVSPGAFRHRPIGLLQ